METQPQKPADSFRGLGQIWRRGQRATGQHCHQHSHCATTQCKTRTISGTINGFCTHRDVSQKETRWDSETEAAKKEASPETKGKRGESLSPKSHST